MSQLRFSAFKNQDAADCSKLWDYYEGEQLPWVKATLDGSGPGGYGKRRDWTGRGFIPRFRNITKAIVDKSAKAFNNPPTIDTYNALGEVTPNPILDQILTDSDWLSFWQSAAAMVRLQKTVVIYCQKYIPFEAKTENGIYKYNPMRGESLKMMVTHHGNSEVIVDPTGKYILEYAYLVDLDRDLMPEDCTDEHSPQQYMVVTPDSIETWMNYNDKDVLVDTVVNPEGFVPAFLVHDTNKPVYDIWNHPGTDLGSLNELINLHLTDTEFAVAWQKQPTLFTNGTISPNTNAVPMVPTVLPGHTNPGQMYQDIQYLQNNGVANVGGLGSIVQITADDNNRDPMIKYEGTNTRLEELNTVMHTIAEDVAHDWSVNVRMAGTGSANSGFQLVVEEMDGLDLMNKQNQFWQSAFKTFYRILQLIYPELPEGTLFIEFPPATLPVNVQEQEAIWDMKIASGRASIVDYLMATQELTQDQAIAKAQEIMEFNQKFIPVPVPPMVEVKGPMNIPLAKAAE